MEWVVNAMPRLLYPWERPSTHCTGGRVGLRTGLDGCGKSRDRRYLIPGPPAHSNLLYWLGYPGPPIYIYSYIYCVFFISYHWSHTLFKQSITT